ncbi:MAG TPA: DUF3090 family protein [Acidimicrobiales bacterium]|nr:DUF3090 family protein [Acidimicrobiales bacterium]
MSDSWDLGDVEQVTVGTVGPVGQRVFLLQAARAGEVVTLKVEKAQVAALAEYLGDLLRELGRPPETPDAPDLVEPAEPAWVVGSLGLSWDDSSARIVLVAEEAVGEDEPAAMARLTLTAAQAAALAVRGVRLVEAGRPPCPLCGFPLDPGGHVCPRTNGHRPAAR